MKTQMINTVNRYLTKHAYEMGYVRPQQAPYVRTYELDPEELSEKPIQRKALRALSEFGYPALGGIIGSAVDGIPGAVAGTVIGFAPNVVGSIAALLTKKRSAADQFMASRSNWGYLVPGYATYDRYKTMGRNLVLEPKE